MALELLFTGPGLDVIRLLSESDGALIVGRDPDCDVCLPDPGRNVSRHHLSLWNEGDALHFHVLSVVNGVTTSAGEAPPGARGVLPAGATLRLAAYCIGVREAGATADPWSVFDREASGIAPVHPQLAQLLRGSVATPAAEEDPFGDWGFEATFGSEGLPRSLQGAPLQPAPGMGPFLRGLGLEAELADLLVERDVERLGALMRLAVEGLIGLARRAGCDPGGAAANPLLTSDALRDKLRDLVRSARVAGPSAQAPEDALRGLIDLAHQARPEPDPTVAQRP